MNVSKVKRGRVDQVNRFSSPGNKQQFDVGAAHVLERLRQDD